MTTWIAVLAVGAGSYLLRSLPLLSQRASDLDPRVQRLVGYAGLAAITALIAAALRHHTAVAGWAPGAVALAAAGVAGVLSHRGRSFAVALGVALGGYVAVTQVLGLS